MHPFAIQEAKVWLERAIILPSLDGACATCVQIRRWCRPSCSQAASVGTLALRYNFCIGPLIVGVRVISLRVAVLVLLS